MAYDNTRFKSSEWDANALEMSKPMATQGSQKRKADEEAVEELGKSRSDRVKESKGA